MENPIKDEIVEAVRALGYSKITIRIAIVAHQRYKVSVKDGETIGIYDADKHTFID